MNNYDYNLVLNDAVVFAAMQKNENYKKRLQEAYNAVKAAGIKNYEEFENSNLGIGAFEYNAITIFDRLKKEDYYRALNVFCLNLASVNNMDKDYGDRLASWGTIGETPYREELIKNGDIIYGLTEEEKNKYHK